VLHLKLVGATGNARIVGVDELPGKSNYFIDTDPATWRTNVPTYAKVRYEGIYPGIDLVYYGYERQLEYDFILAPGRTPETIRLAFDGAEHLEVNTHGDLIVHLDGKEIRIAKPVIYQEVGGERRGVAGGYVIEASNKVYFAAKEYDRRIPLVIDPVIIYSTYLGSAGAASWELLRALSQQMRQAMLLWRARLARTSPSRGAHFKLPALVHFKRWASSLNLIQPGQTLFTPRTSMRPLLPLQSTQKAMLI
jgi:hypothetical protein